MKHAFAMRTAPNPPVPHMSDEDTTDDIRQVTLWGNKYFLAMQEPDGHLMSHIGGDVERHGDNNRFTDNQPGTADDRVIAADRGGTARRPLTSTHPRPCGGKIACCVAARFASISIDSLC